jgi:ribosomal protein L7/L12
MEKTMNKTTYFPSGSLTDFSTHGGLVLGGKAESLMFLTSQQIKDLCEKAYPENKIKAIQILRVMYPFLGLKEARDIVEAIGYPAKEFVFKRVPDPSDPEELASTTITVKARSQYQAEAVLRGMVSMPDRWELA